jgi:hypothetical protein
MKVSWKWFSMICSAGRGNPEGSHVYKEIKPLPLDPEGVACYYREIFLFGIFYYESLSATI